MKAADGKLGDFIDWASASGLGAARLADYRRIAVELFELAGGTRITESHILRLIDTYADRAGGRAAMALIEEVGEALLRFEAVRKLQGPAPSMAAPVPGRRTPSEPFTARPDERVSVELRPPSQRETPPPQQVVSFTGGPAPRRRRATGAQYRCRQCQTMVVPNESGDCPRCGTPAPRVSSSQVSVVAPERSRSASWLLPLVLGLLAFAVAFEIGPGLIDRLRHPSEAVAGVTQSPHLGLRTTFPEGWRHATDADRAPSSRVEGFDPIIPGAVGLRTSRYFRGSSGDPDAQLFLSIAPRSSQITDEVLAAWARRAADNAAAIEQTVRELSGIPDLTLDRCVAGADVPGGGLRCAGTAGDARALVYVWGARTMTAVGVFVTRQNADAALAEGDAVIGGLDLG